MQNNKQMKYTTILLLVIFTVGSYAQTGSKPSRVHQAKVQFFNNKLNLSPSESKKFWPVYNDYQSRKNKLTGEKRNLIQYFTENKQNMSGDEIEQSLDRYIEIEKEISLLLEEYNNKFKQILSDDKVLQIYITEVQFRNYLLQKLRTSKSEMKPRM
jgi:hypothetical protein